MLIDGPSAEHELVLQGRLEGQAPDIDPVVYLTDCDPSAYGRGDLIRARIVGAQGYDLARPAPARLGGAREAAAQARRRTRGDILLDAGRGEYFRQWAVCPLFVF